MCVGCRLKGAADRLGQDGVYSRLTEATGGLAFCLEYLAFRFRAVFCVVGSVATGALLLLNPIAFFGYWPSFVSEHVTHGSARGADTPWPSATCHRSRRLPG